MLTTLFGTSSPATATLAVAILCGSLVLVAIIALFRAKPEDVPRVFEAFASAIGFRAQKDIGATTAPDNPNDATSTEGEEAA